MRFRTLRFAPFGPFSDFALELDPGVNLVFGRNEAGKSTALRAVRGLLFGIPERTQDAHRHPATELAVEAEIETDTGACVFVRRRRRRHGSLRDQKDAELPESVLAELLGGIDEAGFTRLLGFGHEDLKLGAEEMLAGKGELGELLFGAAAGRVGIGRVLRDLGEEEESLFKPRARARKLNTLIGTFRETEKALREARLTPEAHAAQAEALNAARREVTSLREQRLALKVEYEKLIRIERALVWIAQRRALSAELGGLSSVPPLPPDAKARRRAAESERDSARHELRVLGPDLEQARRRLAELGPIPPLASLDPDLVSELSDLAGAARHARRELPAKRAALAALESEILRMAARLGLGTTLDDARRIVVRQADLERARRHAERVPLLRERGEHLEQRLREATRRRTELERRVAAGTPDDPDALEHAVELAERARAGSRKAAELAESAARLSRELERATERLVPTPPTAPVALPVPADETVELHARELARVEAEIERMRRRIEEVEQRARGARAAIERITLAGAVPAEADLTAARGERDAELQALVAALRAGEDVAERVERLRRAVARADEVADRLRREATRVAELAAGRAELAACESELAALAARLGELHGERDAVLARHRALFADCGIDPLSPSEMLPWLSRQRERVRLADELEDVERRRAEVLRELAEHAAALAKVVDTSAETPLTELVQSVTRKAHAARAEREVRQRALRDLDAAREEVLALIAERATHETTLETSVRELAAALTALGLDPATSPEDVRALLDHLAVLAERLETWPRLVAEVTTAERQIERAERLATDLAVRFAPEIASAPSEAREHLLLEAHRAACTLRADRDKLVAEVEALERRLREAEARARSAEAVLEALARSAGLAHPDELVRWESAAERVVTIQKELATVERELAAIAAGRSIDALVEETEGIDPDVIGPRKAEIQDELETNEQALYAAQSRVEKSEAGLEQLGTSGAADAAQRLAETAAEIREAAARYARLRLARSILEREVARYRERHQGPVLRRASDVFARLSLLSFEGLRVGADDRVLECVRAGGGAVAVDGLSEGTRYQLYFALRVASLERYLEQGRALPLVLDDAFIHFDDARARVGLEVLAELAARAQVLFFTHHERLVEVAREALGGRVRTHELPPPPGACRERRTG